MNSKRWEFINSFQSHCNFLQYCSRSTSHFSGVNFGGCLKGPMTRKIFIPLSDEEYRINNSGDSLSASNRSQTVDFAHFRFRPSRKRTFLLVMRYDVTRGTVSTVNNTNSIVFSAPFANVGRSNVT